MPATAAHCSLNVSDLSASVAFYRALFGLEPDKRRSDYAKFELRDPPLVVSLIAAPQSGQNPINHVGLRMHELATLDAMQQRLRQAGITTQREQDVECCYSRQTKFWTADPDGTHWEIYVLQAEADTLGATQPVQPLSSASASGARPSLWVHRLTDGCITTIPHADASLDEVLLEGSINLAQDGGWLNILLIEARRALKPRGRILLHGLVASGPLPGGRPALAGPAAAVQRLPVEAEPAALLNQAGFLNSQITRLAERPNFVVGVIEMREILVSAEAPDTTGGDEIFRVVYRGPFACMTDDDGTVYERGRRAYLNAAQLRRLQDTAAMSQFVVLQTAGSAASCEPADGCC